VVWSALAKAALQAVVNTQSPNTIILADDEQLVELMMDHNVGISTVSTFYVKKIDFDYFEDGAL
jgi:restriction endonuclease Mrr